METSLHKQLKDHYAGRSGRVEVTIDNYRIDVVNRGRLIEIQHGSLSAIRRKIRELSRAHRVTVIKPLVGHKIIVKRARRGGGELSRRQSPKRERIVDIFHDLIYLRDVFPHPNLTLEIPIVAIEEWRYPGHGRRRRWRERDFQVEDQKLIEIESVHKIRNARELLRLLPPNLPKKFGTQHLSELMSIDRSFAQRIAYCLREMKLIQFAGKSGNALLYSITRGNYGTVRTLAVPSEISRCSALNRAEQAAV